MLPIEQPPAPMSFAQFCAEDNARKRRRQTEPASCLLRSIVCSLPGRHVCLPPSCSSLLQSAIAEEAANPTSHVGLRGVFEGLLTNVYQAGSTCDLIVRGASAFYVGATVRTLRDRWGDPDHGHFRRWDRMYGLCRSHDAISLARAERVSASRCRDASRAVVDAELKAIIEDLMQLDVMSEEKSPRRRTTACLPALLPA